MSARISPTRWRSPPESAQRMAREQPLGEPHELGELAHARAQSRALAVRRSRRATSVTFSSAVR